MSNTNYRSVFCKVDDTVQPGTFKFEHEGEWPINKEPFVLLFTNRQRKTRVKLQCSDSFFEAMGELSNFYDILVSKEDRDKIFPGESENLYCFGFVYNVEEKNDR